MILLMRELLGNTTVSDSILELYLSNAQTAIIKYCNVDSIEDIPDYQNAVVTLAVHLYKNKDNVGIVQMQQGSRSQTFRSGEIPDSIKAILPIPRVRVI